MDWLNSGIGPASYVEILWTLVSLLGLVLTLKSMSDALHDKRVVSALPDYSSRGPRASLLDSSIERCAERCVVQSALVLIGVVAIFTPPPVLQSSQGPTAFNGSVLIVAAVLMAFSALRERANRQETERRLEIVLMQDRRYHLERDLALQRLNVAAAQFDGNTTHLSDLPDLPLDRSYFEFPEADEENEEVQRAD